MAASFIFDPSKGETPETVAARRKTADALAARIFGRTPQNVGEGLNAIGQAWIAASMRDEANAAQSAGRSSANDTFSKISGLISGGGAPTATPAPAGSPAPSVATPMGTTPIPAGRDDFVASLMPHAEKASLATGVDPRIIVAQAAIESGWGKSAPGNNLFGIKSHGQPGGNVLPTTEVVNGQPVRTTDSFRAFASPADSVAGYADFINSNPRYAALKNAPGFDAQIAALGQSGYATDPNYASKVGSIARGLPVPAPQTVEGDGPSPLDTAQWPAGPVGAPGTQTAMAAPPAAPAPQAAPQPAAAPAPAPAPAQPNVPLETLIQAASNPWLSDGQRAVVNMMLKQRLEQQDPMRQLQMDKLRAETDRLRGKAGTTKFGLTPIYGTDESGNPAIGATGEDGSFKKIDTGGFKVQSGVDKIDMGTQWMLRDKKNGQVIGMVPKDVAGEESQKAQGKAQGAAKAALPGDILTADQTVKDIDSLLSHEGLSAIVGPLDQFRPSWTMGESGRDALARFNQLKGRAFLQAYSTLRGGGQITEVEGVKAENAMARMDRAQSEESFKAALSDFRDAVKQGMEKLREKAGAPAPETPTAPTVPGGWQDVGGVKIRRKQ